PVRRFCPLRNISTLLIILWPGGITGKEPTGGIQTRREGMQNPIIRMYISVMKTLNPTPNGQESVCPPKQNGNMLQGQENNTPNIIGVMSLSRVGIGQPIFFREIFPTVTVVKMGISK